MLDRDPGIEETKNADIESVFRQIEGAYRKVPAEAAEDVRVFDVEGLLDFFERAASETAAALEKIVPSEGSAGGGTSVNVNTADGEKDQCSDQSAQRICHKIIQLAEAPSGGELDKFKAQAAEKACGSAAAAIGAERGKHKGSGSPKGMNMRMFSRKKECSLKVEPMFRTDEG